LHGAGWLLRRPGTALRLEDSLSRRGEFLQFGGRPSGARDEVAAAVWTGVIELLLGAWRAERALECADASLLAVRSKIAVAALAVGSKFKHGRLRSWRESGC
jgi:hypothetical protein